MVKIVESKAGSGLPITKENVKQGLLIWYAGEGSVHAWSVPAVIKKVNRKRGTFSIVTLDDFQEIGDFQISWSAKNENMICESRKGMRTITVKRARQYLVDREDVLQKKITDAEEGVRNARQTLRTFLDGKTKMNLNVLSPEDVVI